LNKNINTVNGALTAVFPLTSGDPLAQFTVVSTDKFLAIENPLRFTALQTINGSLYFGTPDVKTTKLILNVVASKSAPSVSLEATIAIDNLGNDEQELVFDVSADAALQQLQFTGSLQVNIVQLSS